MAREYRARMGAFDIGKWEYREVEALARRYRSIKRRATVLEQCNATGSHGEQYAAMKWECSIVEQALKETADGKWEKALALSCCDGVAYADIDPVLMKSSNRNEFYEVKREFFWRLWGLKQEAIGKAAKTSADVKSQ